jgi:hypothetical protein
VEVDALHRVQGGAGAIIKTSMSSLPASGSASPSVGPRRIELKLRDMRQLFNSMDPSPFQMRDLDDDAEEFIVSWAHAYSLEEPITLRIQLEEWPRGGSSRS